MMHNLNKKKKGFSLIEILVVIAIIGILATVIIVNVNAAKNKAKDTVAIAGMDQIRTTGEIYYNGAGVGTYAGLCAYADIDQIFSSVGAQGSVATSCLDDIDTYCASASLPSDPSTILCRDHLGNHGSAACVDATGCP